MDALVTAFVAASLGEWGDQTQLIVAMLAARSGRPGRVLIGLFLAALVGSLVAAFAGILIGSTITIRAMTLMVALALLFAGVSGLIRRKAPSVGSTRLPLILAAFILCLAAEIGDRTQFITFALAGRFNSPRWPRPARPRAYSPPPCPPPCSANGSRRSCRCARSGSAARPCS